MLEDYYLTKEEYKEMQLRFGSLLYDNKCTVDVLNQDDGYVIRVSEGIDIDFYADVYSKIKGDVVCG